MLKGDDTSIESKLDLSQRIQMQDNMTLESDRETRKEVRLVKQIGGKRGTSATPMEYDGTPITKLIPKEQIPLKLDHLRRQGCPSQEKVLRLLLKEA